MVLPASIILIAICASMAFTAPILTEWENYKMAHKKKYDSEEENIRQQIWHNNTEHIKQHNSEADKGQHSYRLAHNKYSDLTTEEFREVMNGYRPNLKHRTGTGSTSDTTTKHSTTVKATKRRTTTTKASTMPHATTKTSTVSPTITKTSTAIPSSIDWRTHGYVTPVKDQGHCGSCWSFSATGALEGQHFKKTGTLVSLSEQNLVDCNLQNKGCNGGVMEWAFDYIQSNKGVDIEASYPYQASRRSCHFDTTKVGATDTGYVDIQKYDETALKVAVATIGPISVAIDASWKSFQFYSSGVYNEPRCSSHKLDHAVLVVGYGTLNSVDYWLVKNSWGTTWGQQGYIMMKRNANNQCGIATSASYPTV